jgi:transcriptional regulator with XRE-family HTH domain
MDNKLAFGDFIIQRRLGRGMSARELAKALGISAVYMCDIEKNRRFPVSDEFLENLIRVLELDEDETALMYDLVAIARNSISPDLPQYIMENELIRTALRQAKKNQIPDEKWEKFISEIIRKDE